MKPETENRQALVTEIHAATESAGAGILPVSLRAAFIDEHKIPTGADAVDCP